MHIALLQPTEIGRSGKTTLYFLLMKQIFISVVSACHTDVQSHPMEAHPNRKHIFLSLFKKRGGGRGSQTHV